MNKFVRFHIQVWLRVSYYLKSSQFFPFPIMFTFVTKNVLQNLFDLSIDGMRIGQSLLPEICHWCIRWTFESSDFCVFCLTFWENDRRFVSRLWYDRFGIRMHRHSFSDYIHRVLSTKTLGQQESKRRQTSTRRGITQSSMPSTESRKPYAKSHLLKAMKRVQEGTFTARSSQLLLFNPIKAEGGWVYNHREKSDTSSHT
jgi:hypothetical protein